MNQKDTDKLLRRRLYLQRYVTSLRNDLYGLYTEGDRRLLALLSEFLADADDRTRGAFANQRTSNREAARILSGMKNIMIYQRDVTIALIANEMKELVDLEMEYTARVMNAEIPSAQGVASTPVAGQNPAGIIAAAFLIYATRLIAESTQAAASNPDNAVRVVRGTRAQGYRDGLFEWRNNRLIRPNVDLIVNSTASNAVERVFVRSGVEKVDHIATLDFRVCLECAAAEVNGPYEIGTQPRIQLHPNCRCINTPFDPNLDVERPFVRDSRSVKDIPKDERGGKIGTTKDSMEQFINRMTDAERREWMGPRRAEMWANGEYDDIRLLVNEVTGEPLRLDELPTESNTEEEGANVNAERDRAAAEREVQEEEPVDRIDAVHQIRRDYASGLSGESGNEEDRPFTEGSRRHWGRLDLNGTPLEAQPAVLDQLGAAGESAPRFIKVDDGASKFHELISTSKSANPYGASVYVYDEADYEDMDLYLTESGASGFAVKPDGDLVSVFSTPGSEDGRVGVSITLLGIQQGGRKLDAFDTILPDLYSILGFKEVGRDSWSDEYMPDDWSKELFGKFNNGEPDVVYMEYDPENFDLYSNP